MYVSSDTSNSGGEGMFSMIKNVPGGGMPGVSISKFFNEVLGFKNCFYHFLFKQKNKHILCKCW